MPKADAEVAREFARLSSDCSFLVSHLVRQNNGRSDIDAKRIMEAILDLASASPAPGWRRPM